MSVTAYDLKRWKIWKFVLGGAVISTIVYLLNAKSETGFYQSMHFNTAEILLQIFGYIFTGTLVALLIAAIQNVWVWHSTGNRGFGRPHAILAGTLVALVALNLATLDPYQLV